MALSSRAAILAPSVTILATLANVASAASVATVVTSAALVKQPKSSASATSVVAKMVRASIAVAVVRCAAREESATKMIASALMANARLAG